jgi:HlyD family secretion protein
MTIPFVEKIPKLSRIQYVILAIVVLIAGKFFLFPSPKDLGATFTVTPGDFSQQVSVSGSVVAAKDVALGFAASGRVSGVYAHVGQRVYQGAVIAEIENNDLVASLSQKRFALAEAQANLASTKAGTRSEELAIARATVQNAELALIDTVQSAYTSADDAVHNKSDTFFTNPRSDPKLTFNTSNANLKTSIESDRKALEATLTTWALSLSSLSRSNADQIAQESQAHMAKVTSYLANVNSAINQGVPDTTVTASILSSYGTTLASARTNANSASTALSTDRATLVSAEATLALKEAGATVEAVTAGEAMVAAAQADVEQAVSALVKTRVVAPFTGVVTRMDAKVGEIISPTESLIGMQSDGIFQVETYIPEVAITRIMVGNPATTTLDAYGSATTFGAVVVSIDPAETIKDGVPAYKTTLSFLIPDPRIRSGMTANVIIETGLLKDATVIPAGAVGTKAGKQYVSVVQGDEVEERFVTTGIAPSLGQAHILSGLSRGETILLSPIK